jgi:hypothetical protein
VQGFELVEIPGLGQGGGRPGVGLAPSAPTEGEEVAVGLGRFCIRLEGPNFDSSTSLSDSPLCFLSVLMSSSSESVSPAPSTVSPKYWSSSFSLWVEASVPTPQGTLSPFGCFELSGELVSPVADAICSFSQNRRLFSSR